MFTVMRLSAWAGEWWIVIALCEIIIFFFIQLFLCLKAKRRIVKIIPIIFLAVVLLEFAFFDVYGDAIFPPSGGYGAYGEALLKIGFAIIFPICCAIDGLAWLTALIINIIKKRKAKKQNSVTQ